MTTEQNKATIRRWVDEGWNKGNLAVVDEIYTADVVQHDPSSPMPVASSVAMKGYVGMFRSAVPDIHFTVDDLLAEGDKVFWRFTAHGTQKGPLGPIPPSGKEATITGMVLFRFVQGKVAEVWVNVDMLGLLQQIGVIPPMG